MSLVSDVRAAHERALAKITAEENDPMRAYEEATAVGEALKQLGQTTADLRATIAIEIMRADSLSLAQLADRLGVSKSRAQQFVDVARALEERSAAGAPAP